jgi:hypothetical protein
MSDSSPGEARHFIASTAFAANARDWDLLDGGWFHEEPRLQLWRK